MLLDAGADRDATNKDGNSALSYAKAKGFAEIEEMLLDRKTGGWKGT